jgi:hypothetical protein
MLLNQTDLQSRLNQLQIKSQREYSQHFILFEAHEWAQYARVFYYNRLNRPARV